MNTPLTKKYGADKRWVNWALETRKGKTTKLPYSPHTGRLASSTDAATWGTFDEAAAKSEQVGITFAPDMLLLGIDIDHCVESGKIKHDQAKAIRLLLKAADTYTELSPSGSGLHLYLALSEPLPLVANKKAPFEAYTAGRYFTTTGIAFGVERAVRTITAAQALELLALIGYPWGKGETEPEPPAAAPAPANFEDTELIERMFASKNGAAIKALFDGDISAYNKDASAADMALLSHLAFWSSKNEAQMERVWMRSALGARKKTQQREDYRRRSIAAAVKHCKEVYTPQVGASTTTAADLDLLYTKTEKGKDYIQNTENMARILQGHPEFAGCFRFDSYLNVMERKVNGTWRPLEDSDAIDVQTRVSVLFSQFRRVGKEMIFDAIVKVSQQNKYDSAMDYVKGLKWDGTARLNSWLSIAFGTPNDELHQSIGSNWLKGAVKRIMIPGCKFDYVLVLEGEQGIGKSTSLSILAGALGHVETTMSTDSKDFFMQFQGKLFVEFSEGETLSRTEVKRMKAIITVQSDKYRPPYGRVSVDNPRRCVFAMTTNQAEYLKDETGNRRWLPVAVNGMANKKWLEENREQLFAEAYHRAITLNETTYEFPEEEMLRAQQERRIHDPNSEVVALWYMENLSDAQRDEGITAAQAFKDALNNGFAGKPMTRYEEMSLADIFKTVLFLQKKQTMKNGLRASRWYPTTRTPRLEAITERQKSLADF